MKHLVACALGLLAVAPVGATSVLDQINVMTDFYSVAGTNDAGLRRIQTITAGASGLMDSIYVQIGDPAATLTELRIYGTNSRYPNGILLGTSSAATSDLFGFAKFTTDIFVTAGETFAIEPFGGPLAQSTGRTDAYAGGKTFLYSPPDYPWLEPLDRDLGFITFVDSSIVPAPAAVPEPASWAMLVAGFGLIGGTLRQRRKASIRVA